MTNGLKHFPISVCPVPVISKGILFHCLSLSAASCPFLSPIMFCYMARRQFVQLQDSPATEKKQAGQISGWTDQATEISLKSHDG